jgi:hypothetical protein
VPLLDGRHLDLNFHRFLSRINLDFGLVLAEPPAGYRVISSEIPGSKMHIDNTVNML